MKKLYEVTIPGDPPTVTQKNSVKFNTRTGHTYHTQDFLRVREELQNSLLLSAPEKPYDGDLALTLRLYWTRPKSKPRGSKWRSVKPDADNALAVVADQLEKTGYVANDSRFAIEHVEKHYTDSNPRMEIEIYEIEDQ